MAWPEAVDAQGIPTGLVPPRRVTDARGMDLVNGFPQVDIPLVRFGEHAPSLTASIDVFTGGGPASGSTVNDFSQRMGSSMGASLRPQPYLLGADGNLDDFGAYENYVWPTASGFAQLLGPYSRVNPDQSQSIHVNPDGSRYAHSFGPSHFTRFEFPDASLNGVYDAQGNSGFIDPASPYLNLFDRIVFATGEEWRFHRQYVTVPCSLYCQQPTVKIHRLRFVTSSRGYGIQFLFQTDVTPASNGVAGTWWAPRRVTAYNKAVTYCNEGLLQECAAVSALPSAEISYDATARTVTIRQPGSTEGVELAHNILANGECCGLVSMRDTAVPNSTVSFQLAVDTRRGSRIPTGSGTIPGPSWWTTAAASR